MPLYATDLIYGKDIRKIIKVANIFGICYNITINRVEFLK